MPDIVIIGSGVAAAALAQRLLHADAGTSILMLETGQRMRMRDFAVYQDYLLTRREPYAPYWDLPFPSREQLGENVKSGQTDVSLEKARVILFGGSTAHWGGWAFRLKPEDFHLGQTGQGVNWPFDYEHLEEYYGQAEEYIGVSGDSEDGVTPRTKGYPYKAFPYTLEDSLHIGAFEKLGIHYSHLPIARRGVGPTITSHAPCQTTGTCKYCPFGARYVAANALDDLANLESHPKFEIKLGVTVERIEMASPTRAGRVICTNRSTGQEERFEAATIVIAAGGIESPKLLLRSSSPKWPSGLGNHSGMVGKNLVVHPYFFFEAKLKANPLALQPEMGFPTLVSRHFDSEVEQSKGKFILVNPDSSPLIGPGLTRMMQAGLSAEAINQAVTGPVTVQTQGMLEVFSNPDNYVGNANGFNRFGLHQTEVHFNQADDFPARQAYIHAQVQRIHEAMGATDTRFVTMSWRADHAGCTARMSKDPADGVVDADLRIHGVENVYVCSNAAFSSLGTVNPTLTLTALALRLGDHLLEQRAGVRGAARMFLPLLERSARALCAEAKV
jgi:choline dehydrogenase-like flavoprotein